MSDVDFVTAALGAAIVASGVSTVYATATGRQGLVPALAAGVPVAACAVAVRRRWTTAVDRGALTVPGD